MNNDNYVSKYLKYKKKYMQKKYNQYGGQTDLDSETSLSDDPNTGVVGQNIPNIKIAINETFFWGNQMKEHADVLFLGLRDGEERTLAQNLKNEWDTFMKKEFENKGVKIQLANYNNPQNVKVELTEGDYNLLGNLNQFDFATLFTLLKELRDFEQSLITRLDSGEWLGWIYMSYVQHVLMELDMFERRIKGTVSSAEDMAFYVQMSKEHVGVSEKMTDKLPEMVDLENLLRKTYNKSPLVGEEVEQYILASIKYVTDIQNSSIDLQQMIKSGDFKGLIRQDMIDHIVREQIIAEKRLRLMKTKF